MKKRRKSISRRKFIKSAGAGIAALHLPGILSFQKGSHSKPNFIVIQLDDLGWSDIGIHGNKIVETPNIDWLALESVRFNQFYVNPVCAPTRAALLTGRDFLRTGVSHVHGGKDFLHLEEKTIADAFKDGGYMTGVWGKWHCGHTDGYFPWERGFDEAYMAKLYKHKNSHGSLNGQEIEHQDWADQVIIDYVMQFIEKNRDNPFFCYISSLTCHTPLDAPKSFTKKYTDKGLSVPLATLYGMIEYFDVQLGCLLDYLNKSGLEKNTLVIFMSDNGPAINNGIFTDKDREMRNVHHLKGHKGNTWENGVKSPLFIRWKDRYQPMVSEHLCDITDIFPTLLEIAGLSLPNDWLPLDGMSFNSVLEGVSNELQDTKVSFNYANPGWPPTDKPWSPEGVKDEYRPITQEAKEGMNFDEQIISIRKGSYKLLLNPGRLPDQAELIEGYALFNILSDPLERNNLIREEPQIAHSLKQELKRWFNSIKSEDHSFAMPLFLIGYKGKEKNTVWAKGPHKISCGLKNAFNYLSGWKDVGDFAEYRIRVMTPGDYQSALHHDSTQASEARLSVSIADQKNLVKVTDNQTVQCGHFYLEKGDYVFRIEVIKGAANSSLNIMDRLSAFTFIRVSS